MLIAGLQAGFTRTCTLRLTVVASLNTHPAELAPLSRHYDNLAMLNCHYWQWPCHECHDRESPNLITHIKNNDLV